MSLCAPCRSITLEKLIPYAPIDDFDATADTEFSYFHQPTYWALKESAVTCPLCRLLVHALKVGDETDGLREEELEVLEETLNRTSVILRCGNFYHTDSSEPKGISMMSVEYCNRFAGILSVFADVHDPSSASGDIIGRVISDNPASNDSFEWLGKQLEECAKAHLECTNDDTNDIALGDAFQALPTRVLEVTPPQGPQIIRLIEARGNISRYATLSHCWGGKQLITTTIGSLNRHKMGIDFKSLSKTIQDAVLITRRLGVQFLWVDSLCIIQDDAVDWERESAKMGMIYKNSAFTIAASGAKDGSVGCFTERCPPPLPPVSLQYTSPRGELCRMYIGVKHGTFISAVEDSPLSTRGWVFQERLLSRRILHYGKEQIFFECQSSCVAEDGTRSAARLKQSLDLREYSGPERGDIGPPGFVSMSIHWRWCLMVVQYTKLQLTKNTDKLPAMSGLAREVQKRTGYKYLAGHWSHDLHVSLLWEASYGHELLRPAAYRAPSWSWASCDGPIDYARLDSSSTKSAISPFEANIEVSTVDLYGQVSYGWIKFAARLKSAIYSSEKNWPEGSEEISARKILGEDGLLVGRGMLDSYCSGSSSILCLKVCVFEKYDAFGVLIIEPTGGAPGEYRRIGAGYIKLTNWFDDCPEESIKLI